MRPALLLAALGLWSAGALAQNPLVIDGAGVPDPNAHPLGKAPKTEDLYPKPSPLRVDSDAVKLPEKQFELPRREEPAPQEQPRKPEKP